MDFKLLTMEDCLDIVNKSEAFYMTETEIYGYKVRLFDYRLASFSDFKDNDAFEMRGLCFVQDGTLWTRHLLMNKFFNYGQTIGWLEEDLYSKKITRVQDKLDGSVISFVKFPNGVTLAKSKMSFNSDQAKMAQEVYNADLVTYNGVAKLVEYCNNNALVSIWELVSPENQIVLEYMNTDLVLLQIRESNTGRYFTKDEMNELKTRMNLNIKIAEEFEDEFKNIDVLLKIKAESKSSIEGFVVTYEDGQMAKIKTDHYLRQHHMIGPDAFRENLLVETILEGSIDDVIAALAPSPKKDAVIELDKLVVQNYNHLVVEYKRLRGEYFNKFNEDRKEFALKYSKTHELFGAVMKTLNTSFRDVEQTAEKAVKDYLLSKTKSLKDAKDYINKLKGE